MSATDKKITIHTVDALCGAGKTYQALEWAMNNAEAGEKICVVQPTLALIEQSYNDVEQRRNGRCFAVERFDSSVQGDDFDSIRSQVVDRFKYDFDDFGCIVFVTHATFLSLPYFHDRGRWIVVFDEIPQVVNTVERNLKYTHSIFTQSITTKSFDQAYFKLLGDRPRSKDGLGAVVANYANDDVYKVFQPIAEGILSPNHEVFIRKENWYRIINNASGDVSFKFTAHIVLKHWVFLGFKQVIVMGAMIRESLLYKLWFHDVQFIEMNEIQSRLRYSKHAVNGSLTIKYFTEGAWTKNFYQKTMDDSRYVLDCFEAAVSKEFEGKEFLFVANNSIEAPFKKHGATAKRLPGFSHGINAYQHYDNVAFMSALNPPPATFGFLARKNVTDGELSCAIVNQVCYQSVLRGSLRDPSRCSDKVVIVPSRDIAEWLSSYFDNAVVEKMLDLPELPKRRSVGRPKTSKAVAAVHRKRKQRKQKLIQEVIELTENEEFFKNREKCHDNTVYNSISVTENSYFESQIALQCFQDKFEAPATELELRCEDEHELRRFLEDLSKRKIRSKTNNFLISPSIFGDKLNEQGKRSRELANVKCSWGIWIDVDDGDMTVDDFQSIFPDLRMYVFNTYSGKGRYRVLIPTNLFMSPNVYKDINKSLLSMVEASDAKFTSSDNDLPPQLVPTLIRVS